jgi:hypothetical protein
MISESLLLLCTRRIFVPELSANAVLPVCVVPEAIDPNDVHAPPYLDRT